jgi:hypothetical protein
MADGCRLAVKAATPRGTRHRIDLARRNHERTVGALATDFLRTTRTAMQMGDWARVTLVGLIDNLMGKPMS